MPGFSMSCTFRGGRPEESQTYPKRSAIAKVVTSFWAGFAGISICRGQEFTQPVNPRGESPCRWRQRPHFGSPR